LLEFSDMCGFHNIHVESMHITETSIFSNMHDFNNMISPTEKT